MTYIKAIWIWLFRLDSETRMVRAGRRMLHSIDALAVASKVLRECAAEFEQARTDYDACYDNWAEEQTAKISSKDRLN